MSMFRSLFVLAALLLSSISVEAANRFAVCTVTCTWDGSSTAMWSTSTGGATGASVPGSSDAVILDAATCVGGATCTITVNTTVTVQSITMGACTASTTGCILDFAPNDNNVNLSIGFDGSGTGTRTLNMGDGTWTISSTGTAWTLATVTGLTFNRNASTITLTGAGASFLGGGQTYNTVNFNNGATGVFTSGANTYTNLGISAPGWVIFTNGTTTVVTNAFTFTGTASTPIMLTSASDFSAATISVASGTPTCTFCGMRAMTFTGGATFTANNSFNLGVNTGITINGPSGGGGRIIGG